MGVNEKWWEKKGWEEERREALFDGSLSLSSQIYSFSSLFSPLTFRYFIHFSNRSLEKTSLSSSRMTWPSRELWWLSTSSWISKWKTYTLKTRRSFPTWLSSFPFGIPFLHLPFCIDFSEELLRSRVGREICAHYSNWCQHETPSRLISHRGAWAEEVVAKYHCFSIKRKIIVEINSKFYFHQRQE